MIKTLLVGCARVTFNLACVLVLCAGLLTYVSYRLLRAAFTQNENREIRAAAFNVIMAAVILGKTIQAKGASRVGTDLPGTGVSD